jgi:hypothetical protein
MFERKSGIRERERYGREVKGYGFDGIDRDCIQKRNRELR